MSHFPSTSSGEPMSFAHGEWQEQPQNFIAHITASLSGQPSSTAREKDGLSNRLKNSIAQEFAFINSTAPGRNRDPEIRRLVRGHVIRDSTRRKKLQRQQQSTSTESSKDSKPEEVGGEKFDSAGSISLNAEQAALATSRKFFSVPNFPGKGVDPHPHLSPFLYRITALSEAMYPLVSSFRFNPISPAAWFDCALRDEALFHALLYITCAYSALITGSGEKEEAIEHAGKSVAIVKKRLAWILPKDKKHVSEFVEDTVRTVSCLAITEAVRGNPEGWKIHMIGLKQMADLKGGLTEFGTTLQLKLHRADLLGAVDYLEEPFFGTENSLPSIPLRHLQTEIGENVREMHLFLNTLPISDELHDALAYMRTLSTIISGILASSTICSGAQQVLWQQQAYSLRYALLSNTGKCNYQDGELLFLDETLRVGALLYVQATPQEFPYSAVGPGRLIERLKELVLTIQMWSEREGVLVMWLLFMGGISARKGEDKIWFVAQLEKLSTRLMLLNWEVVRGKLETLWWVGPIHEKPSQALWDEVLGLRMALQQVGSFTHSSI